MEFPRFSKKQIKSFFSPNHNYGNSDQEKVADIKQLLSNSKFVINPQLKLKDIEFVVFDTETTGFHAYGGDRVISIGAVKLINGVIKEEFQQIINPEREIPSEIEKLTGIRNGDVIDKPLVLDVLLDFLHYSKDYFLVAHHADFDVNFINFPLQKLCGVRLPNPIIDTLMLSYHLNPNLPSQELDCLLEKYQISDTGRHNSLQDAKMTAQLFHKFIIQLEEERGITTIGGLKNSMPSTCRQQQSLFITWGNIEDKQ